MKKIFPYSIVVIIFFILFVGQISFSLLNGQAELASELNKKNNRLNNVFRDAKFRTLVGETIQLKKIEAPIVIVNFWASWCIPCLEEMPSLIELQKKFDPSRVKIISVNNEEEGSDQDGKVGKIISKYKIPFEVILDRDGSIFESFNVSSIPETILFKRGKVFNIFYGVQNFSDKSFIESVEGMLKEKEEKI